MQPNQPQPTDWQQPSPSPAAAPFGSPTEDISAPLPTANGAQPVVAGQVSAPAEDEYSSPDLDQLDDSEAASSDDVALLRWQGTEYVHSGRSVKWYIIFAIVTVLAIVGAIMLLKSITFAILIPVMVVALLVYVRRAPDVLQYIMSRKGIHVNDKLFTYDQFKSFSVVSFNGSHSVVLVPRKRFQIGQTLYFPEEIGEQLVDMLAERMPMKETSPDAIDRLLAKLHL